MKIVNKQVFCKCWMPIRDSVKVDQQDCHSECLAKNHTHHLSLLLRSMITTALGGLASVT